MNKVTIYPGRTVAGLALMTAAWRHTIKEHNILGLLCMTIGSALLSKSVIIDNG